MPQIPEKPLSPPSTGPRRASPRRLFFPVATTTTSAGIVGYYYDQLTGDSGDGASGPFKGQVSALGLTFSHTFMVQERPVATRIKYFHEFDARNRAEGDVLILTVSVPL